ncbi:hypothetical protein [Streptomyces sp. NRRL F-5630]|uniref:hypothetical protein n=1 Tax=Streptomyces sp. NRRL F-5630 TaxID=1463864 RepID=UPI003EBA5CC5
MAARDSRIAPLKSLETLVITVPDMFAAYLLDTGMASPCGDIPAAAAHGAHRRVPGISVIVTAAILVGASGRVNDTAYASSGLGKTPKERALGGIWTTLQIGGRRAAS